MLKQLRELFFCAPDQTAVAWRILMKTLEEGIGQPHPFAIYEAVDLAIAELSKDKSQ